VTDSLRTRDGRALAFRRFGNGPVLLCHPGGPGFSSRCLADLGGLAGGFTLVLLDPRGTGLSDRPADPRSYAIGDYVSDVEEVRCHLGLERMLLFGHSHGGVVAMAYAAAHPGVVDRLILANTLARFGPEHAEAMEAGMAVKSDEPWYADACAALAQEQEGAFGSDAELGRLVRREFPLYFARLGAPERAYLAELSGETVNADALSLFNRELFTTFDLRSELGRIAAPTLVLTGAEDFITGPLCAREIAAGIAGAESVVVPGAGHLLFVEAPERFRAEITRFGSNGSS